VTSIEAEALRAPRGGAGPAGDVAVHLRLAITRTARRLRQEAAPELSPSQGSALATIERHGPITPSELAARERVKRPTATRVVARLEEDGLIARAAVPGDARSCELTLTEAGGRLLERLRRRKTAYLARRLGSLGPDELATLERAAEILERMLEDERA
jgi:DNA-binding MarR family transcriptional regulator